MLDLVRVAFDSVPHWLVTRTFSDTRAIIVGVLSIIAMSSGSINSDDVEQLTQLLIGILCTLGLLYFSYIELINPSITVSDRLFATLVSLIIASVGLREFQYRFREREPPSGDSHEHSRGGDGPGRGG